LALPEDPGVDARNAQPVWRPDPVALVRIAADDGEASDSDRFSLWSMPGRKSLFHDGRRLLLSMALGTRALRTSVANEVCEAGAFAYVISSGSAARMRWRGVEDYLATLRAAKPIAPYAVRPRPGRLATLHVRALQALDGRVAGASHRDIAAAIFGEERMAESWNSDSELRAQVRHLLRRGDELMRGGYRQFLVQNVGRAYGDELH
jgi:hypothetical protein